MSCYNELIDRLRAKNVPKAETDSLMEWGFSALEKADPKTYEEIMHKMEGLAYSISQQEAESIVKAMKPSGEKWPIRDIQLNILQSKYYALSCMFRLRAFYIWLIIRNRYDPFSSCPYTYQTALSIRAYHFYMYANAHEHELRYQALYKLAFLHLRQCSL